MSNGIIKEAFRIAKVTACAAVGGAAGLAAAIGYGAARLPVPSFISAGDNDGLQTGLSMFAIGIVGGALAGYVAGRYLTKQKPTGPQGPN